MRACLKRRSGEIAIDFDENGKKSFHHLHPFFTSLPTVLDGQVLRLQKSGSDRGKQKKKECVQSRNIEEREKKCPKILF